MNILQANILQSYEKNKTKIKRFLRRRIKSKEEVFSELCFCLLTPQSKAELCRATLTKINDNVLLNGNEKKIAKHISSIRFNRKKAKYIVLARKKFDEIYDKIYSNIYSHSKMSRKNPYELREWLVKNVKGLGYKEASHFLRNIGLGENLAILDRHVLRFMKAKNLTKKNYIEYEKKFQKVAKKLKLKPAELDIAIWLFSSKSSEIF